MEIFVARCPFDIKRLQREVNILLISDLHYDIIEEKEKGISGPVVNEQLVNSLDDRGQDWEPDIVIVAGDLVNLNKEGGYQHYFDLVKKLTAKFPNLRHAFFSTPGNHDVTRENQQAAVECVEKIMRVPFPKLGVVGESLTNDIEKMRQVTQEVLNLGKTLVDEDLKKLVAIMSKTSAEIRQEKKQYKAKTEQMRKALYDLSKLELEPAVRDAIAAFEKLYFERYLSKQKELRTADVGNPVLAACDLTEAAAGIHTFYLKSVLGVIVVSHNSSFFCNIGNELDDRNYLFLIKGLVDAIRDKIPEDGPVISFMHHPFYFLNDTEHIGPIWESLESATNNNFTRIVEKTDILLSGHVHGMLHDPTYLHNKAHMVTNGTSFTTADYDGKYYPYTYALIKVNKQLRKFALKKFRYRRKGEKGVSVDGFQPDTADFLRYYDFLKRKAGESTTIETEKVRILDYFSGLPEYNTGQRIDEFYVYQLALYQDDFHLNGTKRKFIVTRAADDSAFAENELRIQADTGASVFIFQVDSPAQISKILYDKLAQKTAGESVVYFSMDRKALKDDAGPTVKKVEALRNYFHTLVLLSKKDHVSINMLYH